VCQQYTAAVGVCQQYTAAVGVCQQYTAAVGVCQQSTAAVGVWQARACGGYRRLEGLKKTTKSAIRSASLLAVMRTGPLLNTNRAPPEYEAVVPTTDHRSVLRCFEGTHLLRRFLYRAGRNRRLLRGCVQAFGICVHAGLTST
jgi:hypothetical protein